MVYQGQHKKLLPPYFLLRHPGLPLFASSNFLLSSSFPIEPPGLQALHSLDAKEGEDELEGVGRSGAAASWCEEGTARQDLTEQAENASPPPKEHSPPACEDVDENRRRDNGKNDDDGYTDHTLTGQFS
eukprot:752169-Hanusia_phi.AAC.2